MTVVERIVPRYYPVLMIKFSRVMVFYGWKINQHGSEPPTGLLSIRRKIDSVVNWF